MSWKGILCDTFIQIVVAVSDNVIVVSYCTNLCLGAVLCVGESPDVSFYYIFWCALIMGHFSEHYLWCGLCGWVAQLVITKS